MADSDTVNMLAPLSRVRYTAESSGIISLASPMLAREPLSVITNIAEARTAIDSAAASARRMISIYTQDLEPQVYDQSSFLEIIKRFVLSRSFSKVRVLLTNPGRVMAGSNRFIALGRRLSSHIDIRYVDEHTPQRACAYFIADDHAIVYRLRSDAVDGIADLNNPGVARSYLEEFDAVWNASTPELALRVARLG